jgi:hypothetical protein
MKVWLDDLRPIPDEFTVWVRNAKDCVSILSTGKVELISLDHDLETDAYITDWKMGMGPDGREISSEGTGMEVVEYILQKAQEGFLKRLKWRVHTANVYRGPIMKDMLKYADSVWDRWESGLAESICGWCGRRIPNECFNIHKLACIPVIELQEANISFARRVGGR